jgi:hypothetical protein
VDSYYRAELAEQHQAELRDAADRRRRLRRATPRWGSLRGIRNRTDRH